MTNDGGISFVMPPIKINNTYYRRAIATFTKDELDNLRNFGDLISIDPTYCNLKSNWSVIPLTVIGSSRELLSGGCVFSSNVTNEIYQWLLDLLAYKLPCSSILRTIVSDDDLALDSAFNRMEDNIKINSIKRIICMWHKYQHFKDIVNRSSLTNEQKNDLIYKFRLMFLTRNEERCQFMLNELKKHDFISTFIKQSIEPRLHTSTKAYTKDTWSLGYITSSISESHNSNIKHLMGTRPLTLTEMREIISKADKRRSMNRHYIKKRKIKKAFGSEIIRFMKEFNVDKMIAEAINGSFTKSKSDKLTVKELNDVWMISENDTNDSFVVRNSEVWSCSCGKLACCGLPCSHIMKILIDKDILIDALKKIISPRWIITNQKLDLAMIIKSDELAEYELETSEYAPSVKERYIDIKSKLQTIAELACKNKSNYEEVMLELNNIEKKLIGIVVDAHCTRCGRHRKTRIKRSDK